MTPATEAVFTMPPTRFEHGLDLVLHAEENAFEVDIQHPVKVGLSLFCQGRDRREHARVVESYVELPERFTAAATSASTAIALETSVSTK
jgi:hypothetical protein